MKLFKCDHCGQVLFFENSRCERCGHDLGFDSDSLQLLPLIPAANGEYSIYNRNPQHTYRYCSNHDYFVCNWLVPSDSATPFCRACNLNRTIPDLNNAKYRERWNTIENAKHRLVYVLLRLNLPVANKIEDPQHGLTFDFMADSDNSKQRVLTGHDDGLITLNIAEADDAEREMARKAMGEVYRTVLGHFRHEVGHYYWDRLIDGTENLQPFRELFGDERQDYAKSLERHYQNGAPPDWNKTYISAYATTHPWEDWAETWAHYLHITDTLETAYSFGLSVRPALVDDNTGLSAQISNDPYETVDFDDILKNWLPLTFALNSLNRSMGVNDAYPFVIPAKAAEKLGFIHQILHKLQQEQRTTAA